MKLKDWIIIVFLQLLLVIGGLELYHLFLGGSGMDAGLAITIWGAVITIVFIVFSVLGIMNIEGKIKDLQDSKEKLENDYKIIQKDSQELLGSLSDSRRQIVDGAKEQLNNLINNSSEIQNYYQQLAFVESVPIPDKRVAMYTDLMHNAKAIEGVDKAYPYIKRGLAYMQLRLYDKAKSDFDIAEKTCMEINKSSVYACLADYYVAKEDYANSVTYFRLALEKNPHSASLYVDLANSLNKTGNHEEAEQIYDKAFAINPEMAEIYYNKQVKMRSSIQNPTAAEYAEMLGYLDKCMSLNPIFRLAYINKAEILRLQGKEHEANEILNQVLNPIPDKDWIMAVEQRGITSRLTNNHPKALNDFHFVLFNDPHNIQNLSNLAMTHMEMQHFQEAIYYANIGLKEAQKQNSHFCDGDFYTVIETIKNINSVNNSVLR